MGKMAGKGESPYSIKQEGKIGWLWNALLNHGPGSTFVKHSLMILSNIRNIDQSETFFCKYSESGSMDQMLCKEFYFSSGDFFVQLGSLRYEEYHYTPSLKTSCKKM